MRPIAGCSLPLRNAWSRSQASPSVLLQWQHCPRLRLAIVSLCPQSIPFFFFFFFLSYWNLSQNKSALSSVGFRFSERGKIFAREGIRAIQIGPGGLFFTGDGSGQVRVWNWSTEAAAPAWYPVLPFQLFYLSFFLYNV